MKPQTNPLAGLCFGIVPDAEKPMPKPYARASHSKPWVDAALIVRVIVGLSLGLLSLWLLSAGISHLLLLVINYLAK
jgi:hypothetical protein